MDTGTLLGLGVLAVVLGLFAAMASRAWWRYRGIRVVTCPETRRTVAVEVDAAHAAMSDAWDTLDLRLKSCTRWPDRAGCDQDCLAQIAANPDQTRLEAILNDCVEGERCALCARPIPPLSRLGHRPAFRAPDGKTIGVDDVAPELIYEIVNTHAPVCWDCHVAETFRREHRDLVIDWPDPPPSA